MSGPGGEGDGGFLTAAPAQTGPINQAPFFRSIPPVIYNGLPAQIRSLTGGPLEGDVTEPVGIFSDGSATIPFPKNAGGDPMSRVGPLGAIFLLAMAFVLAGRTSSQS